jgi:hypothetical protein
MVIAARRSRVWGRRALESAVVDPLADLVGLGALLYGSLRYRRLLI